MARKTSVIVLLFVGYVVGVEFSGKCEQKNVQPLVNFNATQFTGSWHLIQRYNNSLEGERCNVTVDFSLLKENSTNMSVILTSTKNNNLTAIAQINDANDARFKVNFNQTNQNSSDEYDFVIMSTNYTSYSVIWLCKDLTDTRSSQIVWVLSRDTTLEEIKDAAEVNRTLTANNLNHTLLSRDGDICKSGSNGIIFSLFSLTFLPLIIYLI